MSDISQMSNEQIDQQISRLEGRLNAAGLSTETPPPQKPGVFDGDRLYSAMEKIYDSAQERSEPENLIKTDPQMPPAKGRRSDEEFKSSALEWMDLSKAGKTRRAQAAHDLEGDQKEAEKFGLTLDQLELKRQRDAIEKQTETLSKAQETSSELAAAANDLRSIGWNEQPAQTRKEAGRNYKVRSGQSAGGCGLYCGAGRQQGARPAYSIIRAASSSAAG